ncbi:hypothetical protein, partial [Pseudomonas aeruginosa]|uniref:hypothetical protein n=1 Tax=Pseudomonas aeruginosa TaxID=287 RepID=UPI001C7CFB80
MDKTKQNELVRWLKQQSAPARRWLRLSMILGVVSGLLIIAQAWLLAILLQAFIMDSRSHRRAGALCCFSHRTNSFCLVLSMRKD